MRQCLDGEPGLCRSPELTLRADGEAPRLKDANGNPVTQGMALGGFAQQALVHENMLVKLPKDMPFAQLRCWVWGSPEPVLSKCG